jgi:DNA-binding CsgD family transcriptional regulator
VTRKYLQEANTNLKQLNDELQVVNEQLQVVNTDLSESNHIKEEYIGHFIKLCSTYIDKMDGFRRMVNKKLTGGQMVELLDITRSHEMMDNEIEELYTNFDKAFLRIFPHFVEKVNELLVDDEKIVLKGNELLNAELRILALIRLGISNSSQIADFLRYSVNTIYNYRAKVKNRAVSREEFEDLLVLIK